MPKYPPECYTKTGRLDPYRIAKWNGTNGHKDESTWNGKKHTCCNAKVWYRHRVDCPRLQFKEEAKEYPLPPEEVERRRVEQVPEEGRDAIESRRTGEHKDLLEPEDFYLHYAKRMPIVVVPRPKK